MLACRLTPRAEAKALLRPCKDVRDIPASRVETLHSFLSRTGEGEGDKIDVPLSCSSAANCGDDAAQSLFDDVSGPPLEVRVGGLGLDFDELEPWRNAPLLPNHDKANDNGVRFHSQKTNAPLAFRMYMDVPSQTQATANGHNGSSNDVPPAAWRPPSNTPVARPFLQGSSLRDETRQTSLYSRLLFKN